MAHTPTITRTRRAALASLAAAACLLAAAPVHAQATGVSVPQPVLANDADLPAPAPVKPSAAIPLASEPATAPDVYGPYVPYKGTRTTSAAPAYADKTFNPDASIVTEDSLHRRAPLDAAASSADPDAGIVTRVPTRPGEINDGTLIHVRLRETVSTATTQPGTPFTAELSEPVMQDGRVYLPIGSTLEGRVSWVSAGRRIGGRAAIHLEPQRITLPDGTVYHIHARVIDTSSWQNTTVDQEGTIIRRDNIKGTLAAGGLATGGAMAAGAVLAGPPGALIGAGVGAGATAIVWFKQDRQAQLPKDLGVIFSLTTPLAIAPTHAALPATPPTPGGE